MRNVDDNLVGILEVLEKTNALVRVRNPFQLGLIERAFKVVKRYPFIRAVGIECDLDDAKLLSRMSEVEYVSAQGRVSALEENSALDAEKHQNIVGDIAETFAFDNKLNGDGVTLCVMDTGISVHSDLCVPCDRISGFYDLVNGREFPYDDNGHGTFVAGVAAGNGLLSGEEIVGVAPRANVMGLKVISSSGETGTFKILDGMQWLFDNFRALNIKVACMSFGADPLPSADPLKLGAEMLVRAGLTVVCAVGNSGENSLKSPAVSSEVISVGACDAEGRIAKFSSRGAYQGIVRPDVYAYGVGIKGIDGGGTYSVMSGTSVSAPYVAGACCLMHQKYKRLSPMQCKRILLNNSKTVNGINLFEL